MHPAVPSCAVCRTQNRPSSSSSSVKLSGNTRGPCESSNETLSSWSTSRRTRRRRKNGPGIKARECRPGLGWCTQGKQRWCIERKPQHPQRCLPGAIHLFCQQRSPGGYLYGGGGGGLSSTYGVTINTREQIALGIYYRKKHLGICTMSGLSSICEKQFKGLLRSKRTAGRFAAKTPPTAKGRVNRQDSIPTTDFGAFLPRRHVFHAPKKNYRGLSMRSGGRSEKKIT